MNIIDFKSFFNITLKNVSIIYLMENKWKINSYLRYTKEIDFI